MKRTPAISFILLTALLDIVGIGIVIPVLPLLVGTFTHEPGTQAYWYGALIVTFGFAQFLCAPFLGALSDHFGRRPVLLLGISGLGITYLVSGLTHSLWILIGVRLLGGALSANLAVAQAYVADITSPDKRTPALGKLGAMFGLGFVIGPMLGGILGANDLRLPFFVAATLCVVNALYGWFVLPESLPADRRVALTRGQLNPFSSLSGLIHLKGVGTLVFSIAAATLAQLILQSTWVLYTSLKFHWGPKENGFSLFTVGVVAVVVQGGLMRHLMKRLGERSLIVSGLASGAVAYTAYGLVPDAWMLYVVIAMNFLAFASGTALQGVVSKAADPHQQGRTMATLTSLASVLGIVAPLLGTAILGQVSGQASPDSIWLGTPFFLSAGLQLLAFGVAWQYFRRQKPV
jgi:DHA1 family tetracycline resistance protein-like MFS transporter